MYELILENFNLNDGEIYFKSIMSIQHIFGYSYDLSKSIVEECRSSKYKTSSLFVGENDECDFYLKECNKTLLSVSKKELE
jgi:hypothetical protein